MASKLLLYGDLLSPPVRAVYIFLKCNKIQFDFKQVVFLKATHKSDDYLRTNRLPQMPILHDGDFSLAESPAILSYLCSKYKSQIASHWYPTDLQHQAKVDECINFHGFEARLFNVTYFRTMVKYPKWAIKGYDYWLDGNKDLAEYQLEETLTGIENYYLAKNKFLAGSEISIADLLCITDLMNTHIVAKDLKVGHSRLSQWMDAVKHELQPHFEEAHKPLYVLKEQLNKYKSKL